MSNNSGTLVVAPVRPQSVSDTYPVAYNNELQGGFKVVDSLEDRDNIFSERRSVGMWCYVVQADNIFKLVGGIENSNWQVQSMGGSGTEEEFEMVQMTESYVAGDFINLYTYNGRKGALAVATSKNSSAHGFVKEAGSAGSYAKVYFRGINPTTALIGKRYFLSLTPGKVSTTPPGNVDNIQQVLGKGIDSGKLYVNIEDYWINA